MVLFVMLIQVPRILSKKKKKKVPGIDLIFGSWRVGINLNLFGSGNMHYAFHRWSASQQVWRVSFMIISFLLQYTIVCTLIQLKSWYSFATSCLYTTWRGKSWGVLRLSKKNQWMHAPFVIFQSSLLSIDLLAVSWILELIIAY